ncbi:MAG: PAS domain S-box protein [Deltaproteobacteria bacterium]|nr:PAS domain S-box protein [Deltaproteobacteria bacterium]
MSAPLSSGMELSVLKGSIDNTNEAFITIDEHHKVLLFNKAAERIFGYNRDEVIGQDLNTIMAPGCSHDHKRAVEHYIRTRVPRRIGHTTEMMARRKDGGMFPADISFSVSESGGRLFFTGIVRDLTETKVIQERMKRSERLAALGQVVAEINHEIKNPLMMIGGFARQLTQQEKNEKRLDKLNVIVKEVDRLENLLKELRDFYLPKTLKIEVINLNSLLSEIHSQKKEDCKAKKINAEIIIGSDPLVIEGDRDKLKQVLLNLIQNSIEAMEDGGNLAIQARQEDQEIEIVIKDNGCGISKEDQKKIFSPFFTTKSSGTGLGLSISKNIIEDHPGSTFTLESEEGKGTIFKIRMPVYQNSQYKQGVTYETD